jgi:hypothetical protein
MAREACFIDLATYTSRRLPERCKVGRAPYAIALCVREKHPESKQAEQQRQEKKQERACHDAGYCDVAFYPAAGWLVPSGYRNRHR